MEDVEGLALPVVRSTVSSPGIIHRGAPSRDLHRVNATLTPACSARTKLDGVRAAAFWRESLCFYQGAAPMRRSMNLPESPSTRPATMVMLPRSCPQWSFPQSHNAAMATPKTDWTKMVRAATLTGHSRMTMNQTL